MQAEGRQMNFLAENQKNIDVIEGGNAGYSRRNSLEAYTNHLMNYLLEQKQDVLKNTLAEHKEHGSGSK